ncbi:4-hydroxythreonine-4-phosphate dehydrogenase PdxA [Enterococcus sp. UD-01]|uniref:4-hydroxythreonine-4-phosphate dehydrogenase PdxA n=1 Tax=Enterococcus sp. UD-01 TaxID=3373911 RepID=UPI00384AE2AD
MNDLIGITIGDPSGIGPEITLKALKSNNDYLNHTIIFGTLSIMEHYRDLLNITTPINVIDDVSQFKQGSLNLFNVVDLPLAEIPIGEVSATSGDAAYQYLDVAIKLSLAGKIGPVVTAPLNKEALHLGGHNFDGHTEIFATLTKTKKYTMMLWSERLSVVHVSTHVALRKACDLVKKERVMECIDLAQAALLKLGIQQPRIAVAGLNPHIGEAGLFGNEDIEEITPAVEQKQQEGLNVTGPVPPDTVFRSAANGDYDIVVAMYHDQGHIPMKILAFDEGVNVTLGLPIIRTSVDHGTAFNIAGKGIANEQSMLEAIKLGVRFSEEA